MDFDVTKVNYGGLDAGEGAFQSAFNKLVTELEDLETKLNTKTAIWQGVAKTTYDQERALWQREATGLSNVVKVMATELNLTKANMAQVDKFRTQFS